MLSEENLISIIQSYRRDSLGIDDGELNNERADALDHYHGRPYGDERDGRSQVVSKDLKETVGWIMPAIMKVFASSNVVEFIPQGQDDEEKAQQETDYTNQVIMKDNRGFLVIHDAVKDALILKNGYFKHYWEDAEKITEEEYEGLTTEQLVKIITDLDRLGEYEILEQDTEYAQTPMGEVEIHAVKIRIIKKEGRCVVEAVPVEEVRVSKNCRGSLQDSPFTEHVTRKTRSQLVEMGMPKEFVYSLPAYTGEGEQFDLKYSRDTVADESDDYTGVNYDRSMDEIEFCEAYIRIDYDDDGVAELRKVVTVANKIPPGDEWNEVIDSVPMTGMVPERVPHRHVGESLDDDLADLQKIKTGLTRHMLDNAWIVNNPTYVINSKANISDFLRAVPGGLRRVDTEGPVTGSVEPMPVAPILNQILPTIDYFNSVLSHRTGVNEATTDIDPDLLKQTTKGAYLEGLNRASQKVEMIIRMLAETGIRELVQQVHKILLMHQDQPRVARLRGRYVEVNPREWKERTDLTVKVGIGTGSQDEKREKYMILSELQYKLMEMGGASPVHAVALFQDIAKSMDFDIPEKYAFSPEQIMQQMQQPKQPPPNQLAEAEMVKGRFALEREKMNIQFKAVSAEQQREFDAAMKQVQAHYEAQINQIKQSQEHEHNMHKLQADMLKHVQALASKEDIAALNAEIELLKAGMQKDVGEPGLGAGIQKTFDPDSGAFL